MALVAGVDSSTQSVKVVVVDTNDGKILRQARAAHPDGTEVDPNAWADAIDSVLTDELLDGISAISVGGQQHGMVALDETGAVVRPALLWNDTRSASDATDLVAEFGGPQFWADAVGSVPVAAFTVSKLRWMARCEPSNAARTTQVLLPHDWLTWRLLGQPELGVTDRGDASGTGYFSPRTNEYRPDLVEAALGHVPQLPRVAAPGEAVGTTSGGLVVGPGTGDNMAAGLALGLQPGDVVISLGTSGTAFARSLTPSADASGFVAGFADATGEFLPLVCTLNAARIITSTAEMMSINPDALGELALNAQPGAGGLTLLPYFDGERTPNLPEARGSIHGITRANFTEANIARAAIEGMLCGLADAVDALIANGVLPKRILLIGGAAKNRAVQLIASEIFGLDVVVPADGEYVAEGAARQAAWALTGELPTWEVSHEFVVPVGAQTTVAREQYSAARATVYG